MQSPQIEQLTKRIAEIKAFGDIVRRSLAFFQRGPKMSKRGVDKAESTTRDPSPGCQTEYNLAVAADGVYAAAVAVTNAAMADEQTKDLLRQAAWEVYWDCESP